jgi:hypothetical protein
MNIGIGEIIIIVIKVALMVSMPLAIVLAGFYLYRRIEVLDAHIEKFEAKQDTNADEAT